MKRSQLFFIHLFIITLCLHVGFYADGFHRRALATSPYTSPGESQGESTLGDFVWHDVDGNGLQDPNEPGIDGVLVQLYVDDGDFEFEPNGDDLLIAGLVTGDNPATLDVESGWYDFQVNFGPSVFYWVHVADGNFAVGGPLEHFEPTLEEEGVNENLDSNPNAALIIEPQQPSDRNDIDFGFVPIPLGTIGDLVWDDSDRDGIQDPGEPGVSGVTVELYNANTNTIVATTTTDANGNYLFEDLQLGDYYIVFTAPEGLLFSQPGQGEDGEMDSNPDPETGQTDTISLTSDLPNLSVDAGLHQPPSSIGDLVWEDINGDGIQDAGEPGISDVLVTLYTIDGTEVATTTTDADGHYLFPGLDAGDYVIEFGNFPAGYTLSPTDQGGDDDIDSDVDPTTNRTPTITLGVGVDDGAWDAGLMAPPDLASLGNFVWNDQNSNGLQDEGEVGIQGITVTLFDTSNTQIDSTTTDGSGNYSFTGLTPGDYYLIFSDLPSSATISPQDAGTDDTIDSDVDPVTGQTPIITLAPGTNDTTWDAGINSPAASLGDFVWLDLDGNGLQEDGEDGISGVTVNLYDATTDSIVAQTTTDSNGIYWFTDLEPGEYYVEILAPNGFVGTQANQGGDDNTDSDINPFTGQSPAIIIASGDVIPFWDAGLTVPASIGDFVWFDENQDGNRDEGESSIANVTVNLYNENDELVATTITGSDGTFEFNNLPPGDYFIEIISPPGFESNQANSEQAAVTLLPGQTTSPSPVQSSLVANPTSIELRSFTAEEQGGNVQVVWVTGSEIDTLGFHIYRSTDGGMVNASQITNEIILGHGADGGYYEYVDTSALPGFTYYYWLVETEIDSSTHTYGPITTAAQQSNIGNNIFLPLIWH